MPVWMNWLDSGDSAVPVTIISIALMLAAGFLMTRITKKLRLPNVTAYIVGGILAGPYVLNLIPRPSLREPPSCRILPWLLSLSAPVSFSVCLP